VIAIAVICAFIAGLFGLWNALLELEVLDLVNAKVPRRNNILSFGEIIGISNFEANIKSFSRAVTCYGRRTK
jgi:hypothetical protein